jgi:hypothetical protein
MIHDQVAFKVLSSPDICQFIIAVVVHPDNVSGVELSLSKSGTLKNIFVSLSAQSIHKSSHISN